MQNTTRNGFTTKEMTRIALIAAISFVLSLIVIFSMPQGGSVTIYLVPLFLAVSNEKLRNCLFIGLIVAVLQIILGGSIISPLSPFLDYIIPVVILTCAAVFKQNIYVNILLASVVALICYTLSGTLFWQVPLIPSLAYNATFFVPTIVINLVLFAFADKAVGKIYKSRVMNG